MFPAVTSRGRGRQIRNDKDATSTGLLGQVRGKVSVMEIAKQQRAAYNQEQSEKRKQRMISLQQAVEQRRGDTKINRNRKLKRGEQVDSIEKSLPEEMPTKVIQYILTTATERIEQNTTRYQSIPLLEGSWFLKTEEMTEKEKPAKQKNSISTKTKNTFTEDPYLSSIDKWLKILFSQITKTLRRFLCTVGREQSQCGIKSSKDTDNYSIKFSKMNLDSIINEILRRWKFYKPSLIESRMTREITVKEWLQELQIAFNAWCACTNSVKPMNELSTIAIVISLLWSILNGTRIGDKVPIARQKEIVHSLWGKVHSWHTLKKRQITVAKLKANDTILCAVKLLKQTLSVLQGTTNGVENEVNEDDSVDNVDNINDLDYSDPYKESIFDEKRRQLSLLVVSALGCRLKAPPVKQIDTDQYLDQDSLENTVSSNSIENLLYVAASQTRESIVVNSMSSIVKILINPMPDITDTNDTPKSIPNILSQMKETFIVNEDAVEEVLKFGGADVIVWIILRWANNEDCSLYGVFILRALASSHSGLWINHVVETSSEQVAMAACTRHSNNVDLRQSTRELSLLLAGDISTKDSIEKSKIVDTSVLELAELQTRITDVNLDVDRLIKNENLYTRGKVQIAKFSTEDEACNWIIKENEWSNALGGGGGLGVARIRRMWHKLLLLQLKLKKKKKTRDFLGEEELDSVVARDVTAAYNVFCASIRPAVIAVDITNKNIVSLWRNLSEAPLLDETIKDLLIEISRRYRALCAGLLYEEAKTVLLQEKSILVSQRKLLTHPSMMVPPPINGLRALAGIRQASIKWNSPDRPVNGDVILAVIVSCVNVSEVQDVVLKMPAANVAIVRNLKPSMYYLFSAVSVTSANIRSASCHPCTKVQPIEVPSIENVKASGGWRAARVSWTCKGGIRAQDGSYVDSFAVTAQPLHGGALPATFIIPRGRNIEALYTRDVWVKARIDEYNIENNSYCVVFVSGKCRSNVPISQIRAGCVTITVKKPSPPVCNATVPGLFEGVEYSFTVVASTIEGFQGSRSSATPGVSPMKSSGEGCIIVAGGGDNDSFSTESFDGKQWQRATPTAHPHTGCVAIVTDGILIVAGGSTGDGEVPDSESSDSDSIHSEHQTMSEIQNNTSERQKNTPGKSRPVPFVEAFNGGGWLEMPRMIHSREHAVIGVLPPYVEWPEENTENSLYKNTQSDISEMSDESSLLGNKSKKKEVESSEKKRPVIIVAGGFDGIQVTNTVECFCVGQSNWRSLPPMPTPRRGAACVSIGSTIIVIGGSNDDRALKEVEMFDGCSWKSLPALPTPRTGIGASCTVVHRWFDGDNCTYNDSIDNISSDDDDADDDDDDDEVDDDENIDEANNKSHNRKQQDLKFKSYTNCLPHDPPSPNEKSRTVVIIVSGGYDCQGHCLATAEALECKGNCYRNEEGNVFWDWEYKWWPLPNMTKRRYGCTSVCRDGHSIVIGGHDGINAISKTESFNCLQWWRNKRKKRLINSNSNSNSNTNKIDTVRWESKHSLIHRRAFCTAALFDSKSALVAIQRQEKIKYFSQYILEEASHNNLPRSFSGWGKQKMFQAAKIQNQKRKKMRMCQIKYMKEQDQFIKSRILEAATVAAAAFLSASKALAKTREIFKKIENEEKAALNEKANTLPRGRIFTAT